MQGKIKLKPSKREKKRYIVLCKEDVEKAIKLIKNIPNSNPRIVFSEKEKIILYVNRNAIEKIKILLKENNIRCYGISGTIKKAKRFL